MAKHKGFGFKKKKKKKKKKIMMTVSSSLSWGGFSKGFQQNLLAFCPPPNSLQRNKPYAFAFCVIIISYFFQSWRWAYCQLSSVWILFVTPPLDYNFTLSLLFIISSPPPSSRLNHLENW